MAYIAGVKNGTSGTEMPIASALYGTCGTAAGTAAKVVTCAAFDTFKTGVLLCVKFTNANSAANPTLNVNSKGAKAIYRYGTTTPSTTAATSWQAGSVVAFVYDGSNWQMVGFLNTTYTTATATLAVASWNTSTKQIDVTVSGVTASNLVQVCPAPGSVPAYAAAGVYCSAQTTNKLTFKCEAIPASALTVNVVIWN